MLPYTNVLQIKENIQNKKVHMLCCIVKLRIHALFTEKKLPPNKHLTKYGSAP